MILIFNKIQLYTVDVLFSFALNTYLIENNGQGVIEMKRLLYFLRGIWLWGWDRFFTKTATQIFYNTFPREQILGNINECDVICS